MNSSVVSTIIFRENMTQNPRVVERNPNLSTKMPDRVGPRKLPKKNDDVHIP